MRNGIDQKLAGTNISFVLSSGSHTLQENVLESSLTGTKISQLKHPILFSERAVDIKKLSRRFDIFL